MKVVFFDRDGTLIVDPPDKRVDSIDKIQLFDDTIAALSLLAEHNYSIVILTNQAGIAEGIMTDDDFWLIHNEVLRQLEPSGIKVLSTYMNGESHDMPVIQRKPGPQMLLQAAADFNLDLSQIYMIGDRESDIQAAINAGCKGGVLVQTGTTKYSPDAVFEARQLLEAVNYIISSDDSQKPYSNPAQII